AREREDGAGSLFNLNDIGAVVREVRDVFDDLVEVSVSGEEDGSLDDFAERAHLHGADEAGPTTRGRACPVHRGATGSRCPPMAELTSDWRRVSMSSISSSCIRARLTKGCAAP